MNVFVLAAIVTFAQPSFAAMSCVDCGFSPDMKSLIIQGNGGPMYRSF